MGESGILLLIFLLLLGAILAVSIVLIRKAERERDEAAAACRGCKDGFSLPHQQ